jgi:hypothetical protein
MAVRPSESEGAGGPTVQQIKDAFRGLILRDVRPLEDREGVRIGEDCRIYKERAGFVLAFLKGSEEKRRKQIRDRLELNKISFQEGKDFVD